MEKKKLVVLKFADNECYTTVVSTAKAKKEDPSFKIDKKTGTWSSLRKIPTKIGNMLRWERGAKRGVIGVYDANNMEDLKSMVAHVREATYPDTDGLLWDED